MVYIRVLEARLQELCNAGELAADLHLSTGQEAISVGVQTALRSTDYVVSHHRTIAHALCKGIPLYPLVAELMGKADGLNGGLAGEMHLSDEGHRFMFSFQLVGTCIPVAAGIAWAVKHYKKTDDIVVVFFGDAATANGQWHEGVSLAAVQKLPLLLVCENNRLAGNVRPVDYLPVDFITKKAVGYGMAASYLDGNDLKAVQEAAWDAVNYVREFSRPYLLECETTRLGKHKQGQGDIRSKEEMATLALRDPLREVSLSEERKREIEAEIDAVIAQAQAAPDARLPTAV